MRNEKGFTLIEIVMVIVILGILAAVAIPRFINLQTEARAAALQGVTGSAASAMAVNYAGCVAGSAACVAVDNCNDTAAIMLGGLPTGYTVADAAIAAPVGTTATCTVTQTDGGATATFNGIRTAP